MRLDVARDLSDSAYDFQRVVWPAVKHFCRGGELVPVEAVTAKDFERQLDVLSGIDAWQIISDIGIRGIASRVQWGQHWPSFTLRLHRKNNQTTEVAKRLSSLADNSGFIRPAFVCQGYVTERRVGRLLYACMCQADDIYRFAGPEHEIKIGAGEKEYRVVHDLNRPGVWYRKTNPTDKNIFSVFFVKRLRQHGVIVREVL